MDEKQHRLPEKIVAQLESAIEAADLMNASFDGVAETTGMKVIVECPWGRREYDGSVTDFIRERVRLHHDTWINGRLREVLRWSEGYDDGSMREYDIQGRLLASWPNPIVLRQAAEEIATLRERVAELEALKRKVEGAVSDLAKAVG